MYHMFRRIVRLHDVFCINDRNTSVKTRNSNLLFFFQYFLHSFIDYLELIRPVSSVKVRAHIETVIITTFRLIVKCWRKGRDLVSVSTIVPEEDLYFFSQGSDVFVHLFVVDSIKHRNRS